MYSSYCYTLKKQLKTCVCGGGEMANDITLMMCHQHDRIQLFLNNKTAAVTFRKLNSPATIFENKKKENQCVGVCARSVLIG